MLLRIKLLSVAVLILLLFSLGCERPLATKIEKLLRDHERRVACRINIKEC